VNDAIVKGDIGDTIEVKMANKATLINMKVTMR
jgi:hypothetical protein